MTPLRPLPGLCLALLLAAPAALAAEPGVLVRETELKAEPAPTAAAVSTLPAETPVEVGERIGAWLRVKAGKQSGWVKLLNVRFSAEARRKSDTGAGKLLNTLTTGRSGSADAAGVRGLDGDVLSGADPDFGQLDKLHAAAASPGDAEKLARKVPLTSQSVEYPVIQTSSEPEQKTDDLKI